MLEVVYTPAPPMLCDLACIKALASEQATLAAATATHLGRRGDGELSHLCMLNW